jgi:D-sedoheptulose 7-phosphate isomerase
MKPIVMQNLKQHFTEAQDILAQFIANPKNFEAIAQAGALMVDALKNEKKILSCGNGGSLCDAMHFAEELTGRYRDDRRPFAAIAMSDVSHMACVGNDYGYDFVFSRYLEAVGNSGDVLLAISTSGNSKNVLNAIDVAKRKGIKVVGLTGKDGGQMSSLCDVEIRAPHSQYADRAQEIHIKCIHALIDYIERNT